MKIALAQINPTVGALSSNSQKILDVIKDYSSKSDLIIFPEMCLTGYPPQDLLLDSSFINKAKDILEKIMQGVGNTPVIIGTIRKENDQLFNTAAVLQRGEVVAYQDKTHLPTYDVFDEDRYFTSASSRDPISIDIDGG